MPPCIPFWNKPSTSKSNLPFLKDRQIHGRKPPLWYAEALAKVASHISLSCIVFIEPNPLSANNWFSRLPFQDPSRGLKMVIARRILLNATSGYSKLACHMFQLTHQPHKMNMLLVIHAWNPKPKVGVMYLHSFAHVAFDRSHSKQQKDPKRDPWGPYPFLKRKP